MLFAEYPDMFMEDAANFGAGESGNDDGERRPASVAPSAVRARRAHDGDDYAVVRSIGARSGGHLARSGGETHERERIHESLSNII